MAAPAQFARRIRSGAILNILAVIWVSLLAGQDVDTAWKDLMIQGQHAAIARDFSKAAYIYQMALKEAEHFGPSDSRVVSTLRNLGAAYRSAKKLGDAETAFRRATAILDQGDTEESLDYADLTFSLGSVLLEEGNATAALPLLSKSLSAFSKREGGESITVGAVHCAMGDAYRALKAWPDAENSVKRCADIREADAGVMSTAFGDAVYRLALIYAKEGKYGLADPHFKLAEKIREKTLGIMSSELADVLESHAAMLKSLSRDKEAARDATLAAAIRRHQPRK